MKQLRGFCSKRTKTYAKVKIAMDVDHIITHIETKLTVSGKLMCLYFVHSRRYAP